MYIFEKIKTDIKVKKDKQVFSIKQPKNEVEEFQGRTMVAWKICGHINIRPNSFHNFL